MFENPSSLFPMARFVPYMGVIWTIHEASQLGFYNGHPEWCNVGQGQPEVGETAFLLKAQLPRHYDISAIILFCQGLI